MSLLSHCWHIQFWKDAQAFIRMDSPDIELTSTYSFGVTAYGAIGYEMQVYGLEVVAVVGIRPVFDDLPSPSPVFLSNVRREQL